MPREKIAALWQMFNTKPDMIEYGLSEYKWKREDYRKLVFTELFMKYEEEGIKMSYTEQDFKRDVALDTIGFLTPEERLKGLQADQVLKNFGAEELLKCLSAEEIRAYLRSIEK
jgi:hypothetical protein